MINNYNKIADSITASEELQDKTIRALRSKVNNKNYTGNEFIKRSNIFFTYRTVLPASLLIIAAISLGIFYNGPSPEAPKQLGLYDQQVIKIADTKKETMEYGPETVQSRMLKEEVTVFGQSGMGDFIGPNYKNIKERYANSKNVIKGHVYSTEYFWHSAVDSSDLFTKSIITIEKSYRGDLKPGDRITLIEHGGIATLGEWIEKTRSKVVKNFDKPPANYDPYKGKSPNSLIESTGLKGMPVMRTGQEVILFLTPENYESFGKLSAPGYTMIGYDGGKMVLQNGVYQTVISPHSKKLVGEESCAPSEVDNLMKSLEDGSYK